MNRFVSFCSVFFTLGIVAVVVVLPKAADAAQPRGQLDHASLSAIYGWAYDADAPSSPVTVHIYVDGQPRVALSANQHRSDLVAAKITSDPYHGFGWVPEGIGPGTHTVAAYAINIGGGVNPLLPKPLTITVTSALPRGVLDIASPAFLSGWAFDSDAGVNPVDVHIYIDGVHLGTVQARDRRDDLMAAGVATDPYHGFTWLPPRLSPGTHTISVWAINVGGGANPELHSSPKQMSVAEDSFSGVETIENSVVRVGVNLSWGGAIVEVSHRGANLVDAHDTGRLIQASLYDRTDYYGDHAASNWGWNPVQGGDKHNHGSRVLAFTKTSTSLYTKAQMLQWNPDNKGGGISASVESPVVLETWIDLDPTSPQLIKVRQRATTLEAERSGDEELPALFAAPWLNRLVSYQGSIPWSRAALSELSFADFPNIAEIHDLSERWAAWVNESNFGLALYAPDHNRSTSANAYRIPRVTSYLRPGITVSLSSGAPIDATYYLAIGNVSDVRDIFYRVAGR